MISLVNHTVFAEGGIGAIHTFSISATGSGHLVVLGIGFSQNGGGTIVVSSVTDNAGNSYAAVPGSFSRNGSNGTSDIWYAKNSAAGATSITVTFNATVDTYLVLYEFSGVNTSTPVDTGTGSSGNTGLGSAIQTSAITPALSNELLISILFTNNAESSSVNAPWTGFEAVLGSGRSSFVAYYINPPVSSQQATVNTDNVGGQYTSSSAAFKPAVATHKKNSMFLVF